MAKTVYVQVDIINALPAALMMVPVYVGNMMNSFWAMMGMESVSIFLNILILLVIMLIALFFSLVFIWHLAIRFGEVHILALLGPIMFAFFPSSMDGIAKGWAKRLFTTIIFGFFMMVGLAAFVNVQSGISVAPQIASALKVFFIIALFASLGRMKGLISDLINERSNFDGSSWKNLPGALIVSRQANAMQKNYMKNRGSGGGTNTAVGNGKQTQTTAKQSVNTVKSGKAASTTTTGTQMKAKSGTPLTRSSKL